MADKFDFEDSTGTIGRWSGTLHDPGATVGDVLTVNADKSISAAAGGGGAPSGPAGGDLTGTYPDPTIADAAVTGAKIAPQTITAGNISNGAVGTAKIEDGAVTDVKLASDSVITSKIQTGAVVTASLDPSVPIVHGPQTAPAVPASTVAATNSFSFAVLVTVSGTASAVSVNGAPLAMLGSLYLVPAGQTIALTYVVAPTWTWFGL